MLNPPLPLHVTVEVRRTHKDFTWLKNRIRDNSRDAVWAFCTAGSEYVADAAPVDTGYMKSMVKHKFSKDGLSGQVYVDGMLTIRQRAFYAVYVEHGTRYMRAQPFFLPGMYKAKLESLGMLLKVFRR